MRPKQWTQYIKRLDDGNVRVIGIEVKASPNSVFIINLIHANKRNQLTVKF